MSMSAFGRSFFVIRLKAMSKNKASETDKTEKARINKKDSEQLLKRSREIIDRRNASTADSKGQTRQMNDRIESSKGRIKKRWSHQQ
jgi:hypothetical protein